jgi:hypothetical protein
MGFAMPGVELSSDSAHAGKAKSKAVTTMRIIQARFMVDLAEFKSFRWKASSGAGRSGNHENP